MRKFQRIYIHLWCLEQKQNNYIIEFCAFCVTFLVIHWAFTTESLRSSISCLSTLWSSKGCFYWTTKTNWNVTAGVQQKWANWSMDCSHPACPRLRNHTEHISCNCSTIHPPDKCLPWRLVQTCPYIHLTPALKTGSYLSILPSKYCQHMTGFLPLQKPDLWLTRLLTNLFCCLFSLNTSFRLAYSFPYQTFPVPFVFLDLSEILVKFHLSNATAMSQLRWKCWKWIISA